MSTPVHQLIRESVLLVRQRATNVLFVGARNQGVADGEESAGQDEGRRSFMGSLQVFDSPGYRSRFRQAGSQEGASPFAPHSVGCMDRGEVGSVKGYAPARKARETTIQVGLAMIMVTQSKSRMIGWLDR